MTRKLKAFGLALVAVVAMSAIGASTAQAIGNAVWTVEGGGTATIEATQVGQNVFTRGTRQVTCEEATLSGTVEDGSNTATAIPVYKKCHSIILGTKFPVTVTMNGCDYTYTLSADDVGEQHTYTLHTSIICDTNKTIETHTYSNHTNHTSNTSLCTYTVYGSSDNLNQKLTDIDLTNEPAGGITPDNWILAHVTISNINDTRHGGEFTCGPSKSTTSQIHGTVSIKAKKGGEDVGITVSTKAS